MKRRIIIIIIIGTTCALDLIIIMRTYYSYNLNKPHLSLLRDLKTALSLFRDKVFNLIIYRHLVILRAAASHKNMTDGFTLREYTDYSPDISINMRLMGRNNPYPEDRIANRFDKGLRYYEMRQDGQLLGSTWVHPAGSRYIDEIGYFLSIPTNALWLRDLYIAEGRRGERLFSTIVNLIARQYYPDATEIWSDTEAGNKASLAAHCNSAFEIKGHMHVFQIFKKLVIRGRKPQSLNIIGGYKATNFVFVINEHYMSYRAEHLA